jgi:hypothetical protein
MQALKTLPLWAWELLVACFLVGFAAGQAFSLGSTTLAWAALILAFGVWVAPLWQAFTAHRMLQLERARDNDRAGALESSRRQKRDDLKALAEHVHSKASRALRHMPAGPDSTWFDWGNIFQGTAETELRELLLQLQNAASAVGGEKGEEGRVAHSSFLSLSSVVNDIYNTNFERSSPEQLAANADRLKRSLFESLDSLRS